MKRKRVLAKSKAPLDDRRRFARTDGRGQAPWPANRTQTQVKSLLIVLVLLFIIILFLSISQPSF